MNSLIVSHYVFSTFYFRPSQLRQVQPVCKVPTATDQRDRQNIMFATGKPHWWQSRMEQSVRQL